MFRTIFFLIEYCALKMYNKHDGVILMLMSMTGYGADTFHLDGTSITVEMRSINSRYLDFIAKIPRSFHEWELDIKKMVQTHFHRGRIELYISMSGQPLADKELIVDWELMDQYIETIKEMKARYNLEGQIPITSITDKEDLITTVEKEKEHDSLHTLLLASIEKVLKTVRTNRQSEGHFLQQDMIQRIKTIKNMLLLVETRQQEMYHEYRKRIKNRIEDHIGNTIEVDQVQLLQEVAILAEKGDIAEEVTRLHSHIEHFDFVIENEQPVGRKLDFIVQEMLREVNTIGSKSVDTQISEFVVTMKSEIDKVKEQIQNVE